MLVRGRDLLDLRRVQPPLELAEDDADSRMKVFLLEVQTLPADILFVNVPTRRLPFDGFRWAPRTLTPIGVFTDSSNGTARCTTEGLTTEQELTIMRFPATEIRDFGVRPSAMVVLLFKLER